MFLNGLDIEASKGLADVAWKEAYATSPNTPAPTRVVSPDTKTTLFDDGKNLYAKFYNDGYEISSRKLIPSIVDFKVIHDNNNPELIRAVEFFFSDGTSEKATCTTNDLGVFTFDTALTICILKKMFGDMSGLGSNLYNKVMHHVHQIMSVKMAQQEAKEKANKEEAERVERKKQKAKRKADQRRAKQVEQEIEMQKEAYLRAMKAFQAPTFNVETRVN